MKTKIKELEPDTKEKVESNLKAIKNLKHDLSIEFEGNGPPSQDIVQSYRSDINYYRREIADLLGKEVDDISFVELLGSLV